MLPSVFLMISWRHIGYKLNSSRPTDYHLNISLECFYVFLTLTISNHFSKTRSVNKGWIEISFAILLSSSLHRHLAALTCLSATFLLICPQSFGSDIHQTGRPTPFGAVYTKSVYHKKHRPRKLTYKVNIISRFETQVLTLRTSGFIRPFRFVDI